MATIGDLVVKLRLSNGTFRQNMQDAGRQAQQLDYDIVKLERSTLLAEDSTARLGRAMASPIYRAQQWATAQAKSNQSVMQARAANDQLAAGLANSTVQTNLATQASLKLDREIMETQQQTKLLAATQADASMQAKQLALSEAQAAQALVQTKSATAQLAISAKSAAIAESNLAMAAEQMLQRSLQAAQAQQQLATATEHFGRTATVSAATMRRYRSEFAKGAAATAGLGMSSGKAQLAISQLIFAVDDASTVYGTAGLSGAVRAAGNNLTMFASLLGGPYALAAAVALSAGMQLYLTFTKEAKAADNETEAIKRQIAALRERAHLLGVSTTSDKANKNVDELRSELREIEIQKKLLQQQQSDAQNKSRMAHIADKATYWNYVSGGINSQQYMFARAHKDEIAEAVRQRDLAKAAAQELIVVAERQSQAEAHINALLKQRSSLYKRETGGAIAELTRQQLEFNAQNDARRAEEQKKQSETEQQAKISVMRWGFDQQRERFREIRPDLAQKMDVADQYRERMTQLNAVGLAMPKAMRDQIANGFLGSALQQMKKLSVSDPARGPAGLEQGSRESLERIRQRDLERSAPKQTQEQLLQELVKLIKASSTIEKTQNETLSKILIKQPTASDLR